MRLPGIVQWFRFEHYDEAESTILTLRELGVSALRTAFSWADWERPGGREWFDWFVGRCYRANIELMPCLFYTPTGRAYRLLYQSIDDARTCSPPGRLIDYAQFEEAVLCRYGDKIGDYIQIWNEQNNPSYWRHDPKYHRFACMARLAAEVAQGHGKKAVLGSIIPPYVDWLRLMRKYGILELYDAVAIHAFPGTWDKMDWQGWRVTAELVRKELDGQELWVTETGFSAVTLDDQGERAQLCREKEQIAYFESACNAPVERVFWHCAIDQALDHPTDNYLNRGTPCDPRAYYFGLVSREGRRKPLFGHWQSMVRDACGSKVA